MWAFANIWLIFFGELWPVADSGGKRGNSPTPWRKMVKKWHFSPGEYSFIKADPSLCQPTAFNCKALTWFSQFQTLDWRLTSYISLNEIAVFKKLKNLKHILLENANRCKPNRPEPIPWLPGRRCRLPLKPPLLSNYISTNLETLVVRNYSRITDDTLREVEELFKRIKLLDVTGTKCTAEKVAIFQIRCPDIKILHESITENAELGIGLSESSEPTEDCIMWIGTRSMMFHR